MAAHDTKTPGSCLGKRKHTKAEAKDALKRLLNKGGPWSHGMNSYRCVHCGHWHVGHKEPWVWKSLPKRIINQ